MKARARVKGEGEGEGEACGSEVMITAPTLLQATDADERAKL